MRLFPHTCWRFLTPNTWHEKGFWFQTLRDFGMLALPPLAVHFYFKTQTSEISWTPKLMLRMFSISVSRPEAWSTAFCVRRLWCRPEFSRCVHPRNFRNGHSHWRLPGLQGAVPSLLKVLSGSVQPSTSSNLAWVCMFCRPCGQLQHTANLWACCGLY